MKASARTCVRCGAFDLAVNTHRLGLHGAASAIEAALFGLAGPTR